MIMLTTKYNSDYAPLVFEPLEGSAFANITARVSKTKTLDGGVVAEHRGVCHGDRSFTIKVNLSDDEMGNLRDMMSHYSAHICMCDEGVFDGIIESVSGDAAEKTIKFSVSEKRSDAAVSVPLLAIYEADTMISSPHAVADVEVGNTVSYGFYLRNIGDATLYLVGDPIISESVPSDDFSVDLDYYPTGSVIPAGEYTLFNLDFTPLSVGIKTVTIQMETNTGTLTHVFTGTGL